MEQTGGVICDNPNCDFKSDDISIDEYKNWINRPCPKCGENLLTQTDYDNFMTFAKGLAFINSLSKEQLAEFINTFVPGIDATNDNLVDLVISSHNGIKIEIKKT